MKETIAKFVDHLVEGEETILGSNTDSLTVHEVLTLWMGFFRAAHG